MKRSQFYTLLKEALEQRLIQKGDSGLLEKPKPRFTDSKLRG
jgi:hypothetical protein